MGDADNYSTRTAPNLQGRPTASDCPMSGGTYPRILRVKGRSGVADPAERTML